MNLNFDMICEIAKHDALTLSKLCVASKKFIDYVKKNEKYSYNRRLWFHRFTFSK